MRSGNFYNTVKTQHDVHFQCDLYTDLFEQDFDKDDIAEVSSENANVWCFERFYMAILLTLTLRK